jgi:CDP-diacylglycerol--glycerol-3-phosphate 3-phosphatidyltransferase
MGWANRITLGRAVLTLVVWALLVYGIQEPARWVWVTSAWIFFFAGITDFVDGALARHFGEVTVFGRIADPLVDKMLTIGTLIVLLGVPSAAPWLPSWAVALIFTREILVTTVRGTIEGRGLNFQAIWWGKYKMVLQCAAVVALMLCAAGVDWTRDEIPALAGLPGAPGLWNLAYVLVWISTLITIASGFIYVARARKILLDA